MPTSRSPRWPGCRWTRCPAGWPTPARGGGAGGDHLAGRRLRGARAVVALLFAVLLPLLISAAVTSPAAAGDAPGTLPSTSAGATPTGGAAPGSAAVDPDYPYVGYLKATIAGISPTVVTSTAGDELRV